MEETEKKGTYCPGIKHEKLFCLKDELFHAQSKSSRLEARCNDLEAENTAADKRIRVLEDALREIYKIANMEKALVFPALVSIRVYAKQALEVK